MGARRKKSRKPYATKAEEFLSATVFYTDYCLGKSVGLALRAAGLRVELHADHFADDIPDQALFAETGQRGWVMLTKDKRMRRTSAELQVLVAANARVFTLAGGNLTGQQMQELFLEMRHKMGRFLKNNKAPFLAVVYSDSIRPLELPTQEKTVSRTEDQ